MNHKTFVTVYMLQIINTFLKNYALCSLKLN